MSTTDPIPSLMTRQDCQQSPGNYVIPATIGVVNLSRPGLTITIKPLNRTQPSA